MQLKTFEFNGQVVEFEQNPQSLMVNATQMAKIFNKQVAVYMRNEQTKLLIKHCLNSEDSHYLNIHKREDLVISRQNSGTWMHNYLALNFAAWLSPAFNFWVFKTIRQILAGEKIETPDTFLDRRRLLFEKQELLSRKFELEQELKEEWRRDPRFQEVEEIGKKVKRINASLRDMDEGILQYRLLLN